MAAADDDDAVVIEMDVTDEIRAVVSEQFRQKLPPDYEFDEASFIEFIMLLVANRRSKAQIRREMEPFVGTAAGALVDWLFAAMNAMKPPPAAARPRLASVVLVPAAAADAAVQDAEPAPAAPPSHRKTPSATRLLTNAAKDAAKSTSERRPTPVQPPSPAAPTSIATRRARFAAQTTRPTELHTRRLSNGGGGGVAKRSRSPRVAVMDQEAKRLKAQVPQNLDRLLDRKLPTARRELRTKRAQRRSPSPPPDAERFRADSENEEARPLRRRPRISADKLDQVLSRTLSGPGGRRDDDEPRRVNGTTFTVSITNDEVVEENGAVETEPPHEPKVVFKVPGVVMPKSPEEKVTAAAAAAVTTALPKKPTRCAFWPKCDKGDACAFVHPTQPCKYWPSCQFGDKCLYIHDKNLPNVTISCKFGAKCTRGADCKFSHGAAAAATSAANAATAAVAEGQTKVCRYDKRCTKISCPFKHPEREKSEYFNDRLRDSHDDDDEDVTVVLSSTLPSTPPRAS